MSRTLDLDTLRGRYLLFVTETGHALVRVDEYANDAHPIFDRVQDELDAEKAAALAEDDDDPATKGSERSD